MSIVTLTYPCHTAHLDPMTGTGILVMPRPEDDLALGSPASLHATSWDSMIRDLDERGWEPMSEEDGHWVHVAMTMDGREVLGLTAGESIISKPTLNEVGEAVGEMLARAGAGSE